jgi:phage tail sheath protein FI
VQLIAALPLPTRLVHTDQGAHAASDPLAYLRQNGWLATDRADHPDNNPATLSSAFVQLAYPWPRTRGSSFLPGGLESPDGVLAGVLARTVLEKGAFRTAAQQPVFEVEDVLPRLRQDQAVPSGDALGASARLADRVSVIARTPSGWRLLSDVTTSSDETYRQACIPRLVGSLVRGAHATGDALVFEPSGPALWGRLRRRFEDLLSGYWREGALAGARAEDAFSVRCDRSTMSQQDLDAGRVITQISFTASFPIQRITVALASHEGSSGPTPAGFAATATGLA